MSGDRVPRLVYHVIMRRSLVAAFASLFLIVITCCGGRVVGQDKCQPEDPLLCQPDTGEKPYCCPSTYYCCVQDSVSGCCPR